MKHLVTETEAIGVLEPYLPTLKTIMVETLEALNRAMGASGESINNRGRTSWFHSIAIEKAKRHFQGNKDIAISTKYQSIQISFQGKLVGRIKKVNKNNLCSNAKTSRNQKIVSQQPDLFGYKGMTFIDIAYKIEGTWAEFDRLLVVCRVYDNILWHISYKDVAVVSYMPQATDIFELDVNEENQIKIKTNEQGKPSND